MGEYFTRFSGKGRIVLPKKLRESIDSSSVILSRGFEECILGFSLPDWEKEAGKQLESPIMEARGRDLRRFFFSSSENTELDAQGRIIIPVNLVDYAHLKEEIAIIGAGDHFEVWDLKEWQEHLKIIEKEVKKDVKLV